MYHTSKMEEKLETKMLEISLVGKKFSKTEEQLISTMKQIQKLHPFEEWIVTRHAPNLKDKIIYFRLEFVYWLEEVKYNPNGYYLDREINFYEKQILRLETELGLPHHEEKYLSATVKELSDKYHTPSTNIRKAIFKMTKALGNNEKTYKSKNVIISANGVKWLDQKYFRYNYLKIIERYKRELQKIKKQRTLN